MITREKLTSIKPTENNPRMIKDKKYKKLVQSIKDFPEMLELRPIIVNEKMEILGGNMRYRACREVGLKEVPVIIAKDLNDAKQKEFMIKDNVQSGEWDWALLANDWDNVKIADWGIDVWQGETTGYIPNYDPESGDNEITQKEFDRRTNEMEQRMNKMAEATREIICPECGNEFGIQ